MKSSILLFLILFLTACTIDSSSSDIQSSSRLDTSSGQSLSLPLQKILPDTPISTHTGSREYFPSLLLEATGAL